MTLTPQAGLAPSRPDCSPTWLDGRLVSTPSVSLRSCAALYAASVFDNCRAWIGYDSVWVYGLPQHLGRLRRSAELALLDLPGTDEEWCRGVSAVLAGHETQQAARVRFLAFGVDAEICARPASLAIFALPTSGYAPPHPRLVPAMTPRFPGGEPPRAMKSPALYLAVRRELAAARAAGFDDVIMLNDSGRVAEASRANLIVQHGDGLVTPPVSEGALAGITRTLLRTIATEDGITWSERPVEPAELLDCDAILLTSSSLGVTSAGGFRDRILSETDLTRHLCHRYGTLPQSDPDHEFLTRVERVVPEAEVVRREL
jgi:branched-chain amino acid aminotransferase